MANTQNNATQLASERWNTLRSAAGFPSDRALLRAAELSQEALSTWTTPGDYRREPTVDSYRRVAKLLQITLDQLDQLIMELRTEKAQAQAVTR